MVKASYWPYFFKKGYRPSDKTIARELKRQFPNKDLTAILNDSKNEAMIEEFNVPIKWTVTYPTKEARPSLNSCLLYTSPSPRDATLSRMPSSA